MRLSIVLIALVFAACATAQTSQQRMFQIDSNYKAALAVAVTYKSLPPCPTVIVCSQPKVVKQLQDADDVAFPALQSAQAAIRANADNSQLAIDAANAAVSALLTITSKLVTK